MYVPRQSEVYNTADGFQLSTFIAALEQVRSIDKQQDGQQTNGIQTIISTAAESISRSLNTSSLDFTWIGTAYLLPAAGMNNALRN